MKWILKIMFIFASMTSMAYAHSVLLHDPMVGMLKHATLVSATDPNKKIEFVVWLKLRNEKQFKETLRDIYTPGSKTYHQFLTHAQFNSIFSPAEKDVEKIKTYLTNQGFTIISTAKNNFYIRAKGSISQVEQAFSVKINNYHYQEKIVFANSQAPTINSDISAIILEITGLTNIPIFKHDSVSSFSAKTQTPSFASLHGLNTSLQANLVDANGNVIVSQMTFTGFTPNGTNNTGYTTAQLQHAYGVDQLISQGTDGTGQTVVIIDECQSPTILTDANAFATANQLPALILNNNFSIQYFSSTTTCTYGSAGMLEETLDVEAVHGFAPRANIVLALGPDFLTVIADVVGNSPGNVITASYGTPEVTSYINIENSLQSAAMLGLSVNVSSGDHGDNTTNSNANYQKSIAYPASSPWATAVGGTSLFLDNNGNYLTETAWGTARNVSYVCQSSTVIAGTSVCLSYLAQFSNIGLNPQGFTGGSTGGISISFPAQPWQQNLISPLYAGGYGVVSQFVYSSNPLTLYRAVPDIGMFANNFPGAEFYITQSSGGTPVAYADGGTSLACPLFSAILTLANQQRAHLSKSPLGLASQYLYSLPAGALRSINNPHGMGNPVAGTPVPNAFQLFLVEQTTGNLQGVVFNLDSSLTVGPIWNDATGVGTPYAPIFVPTLAGM